MTNAIDLLTEMLRIPSLSGQEGELASYLVSRMNEMGFSARVDGAGNAVGAMGDGPRELVLLGHADTVPGEVPVRRQAGKLYGRGAVDAKGPLAAFVCAVARVGPRPGWRWVVIGAVEEEAATSKGARYVRDRYHPDACIIGEPSGWDGITLGYKGRLLVDYRLEQGTSHSAGRDTPATEEAVAFWNDVVAHCTAYNAGHKKQFDRLSPSLRRITSGGDGLHEWAELTIGFRLPPHCVPAELEEVVRRLAGTADVVFRGAEVACRAPKNTPLVRAFLAAIREQGGKPRFKVKTGTSDMNVVAPVWNCPIVAYGPGNSSLDHTPEEHIEVEEYLQGVRVLEAVVSNT
ncbi:MAG: [LysW]-lysine hydrolase [Chloroflexi bacterium]|nr:[LysW]-lysine hydrolase [Chloroflexota bacterium]